MTASGTAGHGAELGAYFDLSAIGAVVVKSLVASTRGPGNPSPRVCPVPGGMLNSVGLQGPGVEAWLADELPALERARRQGRGEHLGAQRSRTSPGRPRSSRTRRRASSPSRSTSSCPNLEDRSRMFAHSPAATAAGAGSVRRLPAAALGQALAEHLRPARRSPRPRSAPAPRRSRLTNTLARARHRPRAARLRCSAPAAAGSRATPLHSVALRAVYDCRAAFPDAGIVGVGGISDGLGAVAHAARRGGRRPGGDGDAGEPAGGRSASRPSSRRGAAEQRWRRSASSSERRTEQ